MFLYLGKMRILRREIMIAQRLCRDGSIQELLNLTSHSMVTTITAQGNYGIAILARPLSGLIRHGNEFNLYSCVPEPPSLYLRNRTRALLTCKSRAHRAVCRHMCSQYQRLVRHRRALASEGISC